MSKKLNIWIVVSIILFMIIPFVSAVSYYVSNSGLDSHDGLSQANAIKTISKVNTLTLNPGDSVLFECDSIWRMPEDAWITVTSGSSSGYITYSSYGLCTGNNKPLFLGSYNLSDVADWVDMGGNIWSSSGINNQIGNIIFNTDTSIGNKQSTLGAVDSQGDFYYDVTNDIVLLYSTINPGIFYSSIEAASSTGTVDTSAIFKFNSRSYIRFIGLAVKYHNTAGFGGNEAHHIIIQGNEVSYMGGAYQGSVRLGDGITTALNSHDIYVGYNNVTDCWDSCIGTSSWASAGIKTIKNHLWEHNIVKNCAFGLGFFNSNISSITDNITLSHNTIIDSGHGVFSTQTQTPVREGGRGLRFGTSPYDTTNFFVKDNIIYDSSFRTVDIGASGNFFGSILLDYNIHYISDGAYFLIFNGSNYNSLTNFKTAYPSQEINGQEVNPLFTDPSNGDYTPQSGSPACTMSSTGSYVGALPCVGGPPSNNPPTQGTPTLKASDNPYNTTDATLTCYNQSTTDADGGTVTNSYRWFRNNALMGSLSTITVGAGNTSVGDSWICEITPYDRTDYGTPKNSTALVINQLPDTILVKLNSSTVNNYSTDTITCYANAIGAITPMTVYYRIYNGSTLYSSGNSFVTRNTLSAVISVSSTLLIPNQTWKCSIKASYNGVINESEWNNASITIRTAPTNNAPTQGIPILNASDNPINSTNAILNCYNQSTADADGDTVTNSYRWFRNNTLMSGLSSNSVGPGSTVTGDVWKCEITPYDGIAYGIAKNSTTLTILAHCGDGSCNGLENCSSCAIDCGVCTNNIISCTLTSKSWNEDGNLINAYNLSSCFNDPLGHTLTYSVNGNSSIKVRIVNGMVNFTSPTNWSGAEHMIFTATDNTNSSRHASTNNISLTVFPVADCGDSVCEYGESCNSCAVDCGTCPVPPTTTGGGGGGGGGNTPSISNNTSSNSSNDNSSNILDNAVVPLSSSGDNTSNVILNDTPKNSILEQPLTIKNISNNLTSEIEVTGEFLTNNLAPYIIMIILLVSGYFVVTMIRNKKPVIDITDKVQHITDHITDAINPNNNNLSQLGGKIIVGENIELAAHTVQHHLEPVKRNVAPLGHIYKDKRGNVLMTSDNIFSRTEVFEKLNTIGKSKTRAR